MSQIQTLSGRAVPLIGNDIDTDRIIPARFLKCVTFDGLGAQVFADDRDQMQGQHPFDQSQYQGATVLVANRNFGCGSSREHAPQAISKWGIRAIVSESFAEIFFGNCVAMGIPCVTADPAVVTELQQRIAANPQVSVTVDLEAMQVRVNDFVAPVQMGAGPRSMFLSGTWDACGQLVAQADRIRQTAANLPYVSWSQAAS
ncbi:3-isopropylmalate dehydratase small subunit [Leptolyngbya sp. FACHB-711]|uniref:3-isopropylmalate dehydratase small subunit n=1 Tax=unclassified Leptolyngbya TaxID=2650499 RepID=UPI001682714D|nr:3-isopropylmalate dehydratase small subunit [Leptolyngbya sp. FACHB-711]MBD1850652.1 3-isopropylmalate dehydratase small subunit [Cyanobacteria bacterium FACHB-502]MBD2026446.1 3-isopropylmalate dehydratase small subunit [Leptolyngbya sp. FACHB-711]